MDLVVKHVYDKKRYRSSNFRSAAQDIRDTAHHWLNKKAFISKNRKMDYDTLCLIHPTSYGLDHNLGDADLPTIGRIGSLEVMIFRNDHDPPHFHVFGNDFSAKFAIIDCKLLSNKGPIRRRDVRVIERWGKMHKQRLYLNWDLARSGQPPQKIEG